MKTIIGLLKKNEKLSNWRVIERKRISNELFFVLNKLETVRATETTDTSVTVYVDHDGAFGESTFNVSAAMTEREMCEKIDTATERACLVFNEPYKLVPAGECDEEIPSNLKGVDPVLLGQKIADTVFSASVIENGGINALEIFIYRNETRVRNGNGVDKKQVDHSVMIEAIPTFNAEQLSVELYESYTFKDLDETALVNRIKEKMKDVRARAFSVKPKTPLNVNVILRPCEIMGFFWELAANCNYAAVYSHANLYSVGDDIQSGGDGDKIDLTMKKTVEGSANSRLFDEDGCALHDTKIIDNGVIAAYFGSNRYGQYIKADKISGNLTCMEASVGSFDAAAEKEPYLDCVSLSGLQLDPYNDYIGGEIRLAYYFDGEKTVPVTSITMSAKLSDVLKTIRLSKTETVEGGYKGPDRLLLKNVTVL